jgi:hypothetical protein
MRQDHLITVDPAPGGWRVALDDFPPMMFLSGRRAEQHARSLAARLASLGDDAKVMIHDRTSALVGAQHYFAE